MYQAFYRKWRPKTFDEVYGQDHITSVLKYEIAQDAKSHAYLFSGSRGTGKTTCAKILAKAVNCLSPAGGNPCGECEACRMIEKGEATDILEMDAASNTGVEYIRDIRDDVVYAPTALKYRVYIIDEVHMLSGGAFNALLKTLEEPPAHVIFVLATTEPHKIPATILSRCQHFEFRRIPSDVIRERLRYICAEEKITAEEDALFSIARLSLGGMRDAISLLELCAAGGEGNVTAGTVDRVAGVASRASLGDMVRAIRGRDYDAIFRCIEELHASSKDIGVFWQELLEYYRDILVVKYAPSALPYLDLSESELTDIRSAAEKYTKEQLLYQCRMLENSYGDMQKNNADKRIIAELALIRLCDPALCDTNEALNARIAALEDRITLSSLYASDAGAEAKPAPAAVPTQNQPEQAKRVPAAYPKQPAPEPEGKTVLRPLAEWIESVRKFNDADPLTGSYLCDSKAYTDGNGKLYLRLKNTFAPKMLDRPEIRQQIVRAVMTTAGDKRVYQPEDLVYQLMDSGADAEKFDYLDELTEDTNV